MPLFSFPRFLLGRLLLLAAVLAVDCAALASVPHSFPLLGALAPFGIVSFAVFMGLGYQTIRAQCENIPFNKLLFAAHFVCVGLVFTASLAALDRVDFRLSASAEQFLLRGILIAGIVFLALACVPLRVWIETLRATGRLWLYSVIAGAFAWVLRVPMQSMWDASSSAPGRVLQVLTFDCVRTVLRFFLSDVIVDPARFEIGTPQFSVIIAEACSGMEGLGLVLVFTLVWLWYFRRESRFPQALLLVPCALLGVWLLNILRIAALVMIGSVGGRDVAMVGFHSQAGWIAFTAVALGFSMATRKLAWVRRVPDSGDVEEVVATEDAGESPATGWYLTPFLAILGASFLSKAFSGYFEWLYPLRFLFAVAALWRFRAEYKKMNWRFGWAAPVTGLAIAAVWLAPSVWSGQSGPSVLGESLAGLSPMARWTWIAFRVAAAVVTVPVAEELAFRGYLARRIMDREFDTVSYLKLTAFAVTLSSLGFGLMHGQQWFVGTVAGVAFAVVLRIRGRFGDAVVAHATANLAIAIWVLSRGDWSQW